MNTAPHSPEDRQRRIIAKIKALQAKRIDAGATEAEAAAAAELAAKLMAQYQIDAAAIGAANYDRYLLPIKGIGLNALKSHPCVFAADGICHITGCAIFLSDAGLYVVGEEVGRAMAHYLFDLARNVIDAAWKRERGAMVTRANDAWRVGMKSEPPKKLPAWFRSEIRKLGIPCGDAIARRSFGIGMAERLSQRMREMPKVRECPDDVVARIMSDKDQRDSTVRRNPRSQHDMASLRRGYVNGADVPISMGVGTAGAEPLQLSGPSKVIA